MGRALRRLAIGACALLPLGAWTSAPFEAPAGSGASWASTSEASAPAHDLHVVYADVAVEGRVVAARVRFFRKDLERALGMYLGADAVAIAPGAETDALVLRYLRDHLRLEAGGVVMKPEILRSGEGLLDREPVWWVIVQYESDDTVRELGVRNTLLLELFDDQRNVMKFVHFPDGTPRSFHFERGAEERSVEFDPPARQGRPPA